MSKRGISLQPGLSHKMVTKYIEFFKGFHITPYEFGEMTLEDSTKTSPPTKNLKPNSS